MLAIISPVAFMHRGTQCRSSSHAEGDRGHQNGGVALRPVRLDACAAGGVLARMISLHIDIGAAAVIKNPKFA
jgi:hypothetical protein